ncbi:butyrophilin subfamily 3 member A2-like [Halichoeres trimaculatus]|uniref:butyrophilin subfamily 3 member A2-like n=1 Tax=Halichoeres trimaculatus TaxID=147232 RepID=UPI003D9F202C
MVMVGEDVVLPCQLEPPINAVPMTIEWGRPDLDPRFVFVWHQGQELAVDQNEAYRKRASLSIDNLKRGDLSLMLPKATISDNGIYRCYIPKQGKEYFVELTVGAASSPAITLAGISEASGGVMLDCESKGWYPQPEVKWLDGDRKALSAGPTKAVRDPDGPYVVSSRATVEKGNSNIFTCRVHQEKINQTQETRIHVPDDFFMTHSSCTTSIAFSVVLSLMFIAAAVLMVLIWRKYKAEERMHHEAKEREQLMMESKKNEEGRKEKLKEELQKKEEEHRDVTQVVETLRGQKEDLGKLKEQILSQTQGSEKLLEETEQKMKTVEKEITEKGGDKTANKAQGYTRLREILQEVNWSQEERKREHQQLNLITEKLMKKTTDDVNRLTERKSRAERHMEQIKRQIEEMENQRGGEEI